MGLETSSNTISRLGNKHLSVHCRSHLPACWKLVTQLRAASAIERYCSQLLGTYYASGRVLSTISPHLQHPQGLCHFMFRSRSPRETLALAPRPSKEGLRASSPCETKAGSLFTCHTGTSKAY